MDTNGNQKSIKLLTTSCPVCSASNFKIRELQMTDEDDSELQKQLETGRDTLLYKGAKYGLCATLGFLSASIIGDPYIGKEVGKAAGKLIVGVIEEGIYRKIKAGYPSIPF